jgi:hypothetical protein
MKTLQQRTGLLLRVISELPVISIAAHRKNSKDNGDSR